MDTLSTILLALVISFSLSSILITLWSINNHSAKIYDELRKLNAKTATKTITTTTYVNNESDIGKISKEINDKLRKKNEGGKGSS